MSCHVSRALGLRPGRGQEADIDGESRGGDEHDERKRDENECGTSFVEGTRKIVVTTPTYSKSTLVDVRVISDDGEEVILRKAFKFIKSAKWSPMDGYGSKGKSGI